MTVALHISCMQLMSIDTWRREICCLVQTAPKLGTTERFDNRIIRSFHAFFLRPRKCLGGQHTRLFHAFFLGATAPKKNEKKKRVWAVGETPSTIAKSRPKTSESRPKTSEIRPKRPKSVRNYLIRAFFHSNVLRGAVSTVSGKNKWENQNQT